MRRELKEGDRVFTVSAFLVTVEHPQRVLLIKHPKLGYWVQPGGHVEPSQDPLMALIEEIDVEVGIDIERYLRPLTCFEHVEVLPLPAHLTSIRIPAGKPNPGDPEH
jgi:8-oxo-dGTP pyrophosphatase MutT (NUDIX family)